MKKATKIFVDLLEEENIDYSILKDNGNNSDKPDVLAINNHDDNMQNMLLFVQIQSSNVSISMQIGQVSSDKNIPLLQKLNKLNESYRFVKFYTETDGSIMAEIDSDFDESNTGKICFQACIRMVQITDDCYPAIMKTVWYDDDAADDDDDDDDDNCTEDYYDSTDNGYHNVRDDLNPYGLDGADYEAWVDSLED